MAPKWGIEIVTPLKRLNTEKQAFFQEGFH